MPEMTAGTPSAIGLAGYNWRMARHFLIENQCACPSLSLGLEPGAPVGRADFAGVLQ